MLRNPIFLYFSRGGVWTPVPLWIRACEGLTIPMFIVNVVILTAKVN